MKVPHLFSSIAVLVASFASMVICQPNSSVIKNNPYSPSPSGKATIGTPSLTQNSQAPPTPTMKMPQQVAFVTKDSRTTPREDQPQVVEINSLITDASARPATSLYRIGVGDVVLINLKNSPQGTGYYTVRENGEIDYPLAGPIVTIGNKTTDEAAAMLRSAIKLFANPQVEVKVQYYLSRSFTVVGLADNPGEKVLRREAMPIFAIRAESEVHREATTARITRAATAAVESYVLSDPATDNVLILAGDRIEFVEERKAPEVPQITFAGIKKPLVAGMKLSQVIIEALGQNPVPKQVVLRRSNEKGTTISAYDIKAIKKGKILDPVLLVGDVIEIKN
ncbi:MAG: polysaccharide biosynthesis/export family protein [Pyrinomonadaceae bacterium]|nr:polysaccharide biosynthesis/export family protein [Pyrinomonadaceae bacterium]